jgi:hypothetical protein
MKQKIFDVIFFFDEMELLSKRIEYLTPYVTKFFVLNFGPIHLTTHLDNVQIVSLKFRRTAFLGNNFLEYLFNVVDFGDLLFDDFFVFSKVDEFPDYPSLFEQIDPKKFYPAILNQSNYAWSPYLMSDKKYLGSRIFQYTHYLQNNRIHHSLYNINQLVTNNTILDNGYRLFGFDTDENIKNSKVFWYDDTEYQDYDFNKLYLENCSINYDNTIVHHKRVDLTIVPEIFHSLGREIETIKFDLQIDLTKSLDTINYEFNNNTFVEKIDFPSAVLYSNKSYEEFLIDYQKNEVLRVIKSLPNNVINKVEIKKTTETVVFECDEILKSVPSELF